MHILLQRGAALAACWLTGVSLAIANPIEDQVPLDLVRVLLPGNPEQTFLYEGAPPGFPELPLPESASILGSMESGNMRRMVVEFAEPAGPARTRLIADMEAEDYLLITQPPQVMRPGSGGGFMAPPSIPDGMMVQLCHEQHGMLMLRIVGSGQGMAASTLLEVQSTALQVPGPAAFTPFRNTGAAEIRMAAPSNTSCEALLDQQQGRFQTMRSGLGAKVPGLLLPAAASGAQTRQSGLPGGGFGASGPSSGRSNEARFNMPGTAAGLYEHFSGQLRDQDWAEDHGAAGEVSATGAWVSTIRDQDGEERPVRGILSVMQDGDEQWNARFMFW